MNYNKKTVKDIEVAGKKVLLRCDFNVPMAKDGSGVITDDKRIRAALPTIQYLLDQNAAVIACSHMGKPKGEVVPSLSLKPVAKRLSELLGKEVIMADDVVGPDAQAKAAALKPGQIMLLENTRFEKGETKNDPDLAKAMASMAEVYVSDAFGAVHRAHASTAGVADYLPAVSGFLIQKELEIIGGALANPKRPLVAILGGSQGVLQDRRHQQPAGDRRYHHHRRRHDLHLPEGPGRLHRQVPAGGRLAGLLQRHDEEGQDKGVKLLLPEDTICAKEFSADAEPIPWTA